MLEPNDRVFIHLISDLAKPSTLPSAWDSTTDSDTLRTSALKALYRLHSTDSTKFLTVLNTDAPPNESPTALLARAHRAAQELLPRLIRKYQSLLEAEARETAHDRFLKNESAYDLCLEDAALTRDSYAGRGEIESDKPLHLDAWGNVRD
jgi:glutamine synthetase adenylyltransferase